MKGILLWVVGLISFFVSAQENISEEKDSVREVTQTLIYPGCESFIESKASLNQCFGRIVNEEILNYFDRNKIFKKLKKEYKQDILEAKVAIIIDTTGKIFVQKNSSEGNMDIVEFSKEAIENIPENGNVIPAKLEDGSPVNLFFYLPVKLHLK